MMSYGHWLPKWDHVCKEGRGLLELAVPTSLSECHSNKTQLSFEEGRHFLSQLPMQLTVILCHHLANKM